MVRIAAVMMIAAMFAASASARPSSAQRTFKQFDLFGVWAPNCGEAALPDNPRVTVSIGEQGTVVEQDEFGDGYETNRYLIVAARRMRGHRLAIDVLFQQGDAEPQPQLIIVQIDKRSRRTIFTGTANESPRVKDGIAVAIGKPTPLLVKCE